MLSIIVPTYNEAENIERLIPRVALMLDDYEYEIVVVDDSSPDGTAEIAEKLAEMYPVRVLKREGKLGLASAILFGFQHAKGDTLGVMDADLQHPPVLINKVVDSVNNGYDIAIGSRYVKSGKIEGGSNFRKTVSKGATLLARPLTGVKDPLSGFFFLKREVLNGVKFNPVGYKLSLEILVKGTYTKVEEVPITFRQRANGKSKLCIKEYLDYLKLLKHLYRFKFLKRIHLLFSVDKPLDLRR